MTTLLIDAHAACYRAYYTTGGMKSDSGGATGIPFGFFMSLLMLSERFKTNRFVFCWDSKYSRRRALFNDYKASRWQDKTEEERNEKAEIHAQMNALRDEIIPRVGFRNSIHREGFEADDLIAQTVIDNPTVQFTAISADNDLFQLLRFKNFTMYSPISNKLWTASSFAMEYGIPARDWVAVKSIAGCPGDGVPGVPGVAIKTAVQYVNGDLNVGKKYQSIQDNLALIKRNYRLVSLPFMGTGPVQLVADELKYSLLIDLFDDLGFASFKGMEMAGRWGKFVAGYVTLNKPCPSRIIE